MLTDPADYGTVSDDFFGAGGTEVLERRSFKHGGCNAMQRVFYQSESKWTQLCEPCKAHLAEQDGYVGSRLAPPRRAFNRPKRDQQRPVISM
jgi:hypothetical protein